MGEALAAELPSDLPRAVLSGPLGSPLAIGVMKRMEIVVSMRLHGLIFAAGQGTPVVGVSYDPKVTAFLRCIDGECAGLEDVTADALRALCERAAARRADGEALEASVAALRALEGRNTAAAAKLLGKEV